MKEQKTTFMLIIGNRGFFPASFLKDAKIELTAKLTELGHEVLTAPEDLTRNGAVETREEGLLYNNFINNHKPKIDGIIITLPNFGDENGMIEAVKNIDLPIFIHAYPDKLDQMSPDKRRDAFCGKFSIMDVFCQNDVKFTIDKPHVVSPQSEKFSENITSFAQVCKIVKGMKNMRIGAFGSRVTAFKTVRVDELTLQKYNINTETYDLSTLFLEMKKIPNEEVENKINVLKRYATCKDVPIESMQNLGKLGCAIDRIIARDQLDAIALRCWLEIQQELKISPCLLLSELNERGIVAACELDIANAVAMHALKLASNGAVCCMDWNNNYNDEEDKCILFHCGPAPTSLMQQKGTVEDHVLLHNSVGKGVSWGCNTGRMKTQKMTYASMLTKDGKIEFYLGEGEVTEDPLPTDYFGCAGVVKIKNLEDVLMDIARAGHRHHVSLAGGLCMKSLKEALSNYLNINVTNY